MWIAVLGCLILLFLVLKLTLRPKSFPPGPRGFPIVGYAPLLSKRHKLVHMTCAHLAEEYGPVVGLYFAWIPVVMVSGYKAVKECLQNEDLDGRPFNRNEGILFLEGEPWREQRRFCLRHLRDFGFGRNSLESQIHDEILDLLEDMREMEGIPDGLQIKGIFALPVINILWGVVAGKRFKKDNLRVRRIMQMMVENIRTAATSGGIRNILPIVKYIAPDWSGHTEVKKRHDVITSFIKENIDEHRQTLDANDNRDFLDVYIKELQKPQPDASSFTESQLVACVMDLFSAGSETSNNFLGFAVLYMLLYPDVQVKIQKELDEVVGRARLPSLQDRPKLIYTEATLMEIQRISSGAPLTAPHKAMKNSSLMGYRIPRNTMIFVSLWSVHMDKDHWGDPETFRPERFISSDGSTLIKDDWLIPFGMGKRACVGESLARRTTFLFFAALLQQFVFQVPNSGPKPDSEPLPGNTLAPKPFKAVITQR